MFSLRAALLLAILCGFAASYGSAPVQAEPWYTDIDRKAVTRQHDEQRTFNLSNSEWRQLRELNPVVLLEAGLGAQAGCLAVALYHEARGETRIGQLAVAQVILNRVTSRKYPSTICGVVFQNTHRRNRCQFSFACDGRPDTPANSQSWKQIVDLTRTILCTQPCIYSPRQDPVLSRLGASFHRVSHYHTVRVRPRWSRRLNRSGRIGSHIFYVSKRVWS
jgi:hypothetical protein